MSYAMSARSFESPHDRKAEKQKSLLELIKDTARTSQVFTKLTEMVQHQRKTLASDELAHRAVSLVIDQLSIQQEVEEEPKKTSPLLDMVEKIIGFVVEKVVMGMIVRPIVSFACRVAMGVIRFVLRSVAKYVIEPVIEGIIAFALSNPITATILGVAIVGGAGYWVWNKFFKTKVAEPTVSTTDLENAESAQPISNTASLAQLVSRGEGNYNSVNRGAQGHYASGTEDLENMTVAEVMAAQKAHKFNAAGRYQIIAPTLILGVKALKLTGNEKFNKATQDRLFNAFLIGSKHPEVSAYLSGRSNDLKAAVLGMSQEFASVANPYTNKSFYEGVANNRASISVAEMSEALRRTRDQNRSTEISAEKTITILPAVTIAKPEPVAVSVTQPQASTGGSMNIRSPDRDIVRGAGNTYIEIGAV